MHTHTHSNIPFLLLLSLLSIIIAAAASSSILGEKWQARFPSRGWRWQDKEYVGMLAGQDVETKLCDPNVNSQAGYFKITGSKDKNYFYWFFESRADPVNDPVIIWLTGGPGCSSILALLTENGPCSVNPEGTDTIPNPHSWTNNANVLWIDQPAGVGFSYQDSSDPITDTETEVGEDLYQFLQSFFTANPQFIKNDFYVFGESYGGKYVPSIGAKIWEANKEKRGNGVKINLVGLGMGNGLTDPEVQYQYYADFARNNSYNIPVVSSETAHKMESALPRCLTLIHSCQSWSESSTSAPPCLLARLFCTRYILSNFPLGEFNVYDIREPCENPPLCYDFDHVEHWLNMEEVQRALHVHKATERTNGAKTWRVCNDKINMQFSGDVMRNYHELLVPLLEGGVKVLSYAGDADFICNHMGVEATCDAIEWSGAKGFTDTAPGQIWHTKNGEPAGVIRSYGGLTFLRVYESGHMVPFDQPAVAVEMLNAFLGMDAVAVQMWEEAGGGGGGEEKVEMEISVN